MAMQVACEHSAKNGGHWWLQSPSGWSTDSSEEDELLDVSENDDDYDDDEDEVLESPPGGGTNEGEQWWSTILALDPDRGERRSAFLCLYYLPSALKWRFQHRMTVTSLIPSFLEQIALHAEVPNGPSRPPWLPLVFKHFLFYPCHNFNFFAAVLPHLPHTVVRWALHEGVGGEHVLDYLASALFQRQRGEVLTSSHYGVQLSHLRPLMRYMDEDDVSTFVDYLFYYVTNRCITRDLARQHLRYLYSNSNGFCVYWRSIRPHEREQIQTLLMPLTVYQPLT